MPLGRGAIARSIMAFLPRPHLRRLIEFNLKELRSVGLGDAVEEILKSMNRVKKAGYAVAHGEVTPGALGIAAPIFDANNSPIASCCVVIGGAFVTGAQIDEIGQTVRQVASDVGAAYFESRPKSANNLII
jgi:DNA-binding IclR family transcriptional regulator